MKKNYILKQIIIAVTILFTFNGFIYAQTSTPPSNYATSDGSSGDPYFISSLNNLYWLSQTSGDWDKYYEQTVDIDASSTSGWDGGNGFSPIGSNSTPFFTGSYNGQDHTIDGLFINRSSLDQAMFGRSSGAAFENIVITNVDITGSGRIASLVGWNETSTLSNCYATGSVNGTSSDVGGLVGYHSASTISNCYATCTVSGMSYAGGLAGENYESTISNSYATGSVSGDDQVGGLVGMNEDGNINNCYSSGTVTGDGEYIGGLCGKNPGPDHGPGYVTNSFSSSDVIGNDAYTGGLIGHNGGIVSNCYATGTVTGVDYVGGLLGRNGGYGEIDNCYSIGSVSGSSDFGGLVGENQNTVNNSFWDTETSGQSSSAAGTGKTTAEMKNVRTFADVAWSAGLSSSWDFVGDPYDDTGTNDYWVMDISYNSGYPFLSWEILTWDGSTSTDWNTVANWSRDAVPTATDDILIPDVDNDPVISSTGTASCDDLTISNGATLTIQSDASGVGSLITNGTLTNNGTVNIQRYVSESVWHLISSPNNVTTANTFDGDYLQAWNESTATWTDITVTTTDLTPVKGYGFWGTPSKAATYTFSGTPNTGNQSLAVTYTEVVGYGNDGGNLLGNPYPSSIDWGGLDDTWGAVYYWNGTQYASWNDGSATNGGVQYIPPMQGFFIVVSTSGTFSLTNSNRTNDGASAYFKASAELPSNSLILEAKSGGLTDELFIRIDNEATEDFELTRDAYKFPSDTEGLSQLYSFTGEKTLSIDVRPETEIIQLGFQNDENGIYSIGIKEIADLSGVKLEDTKTGTFHNLQSGSYEFAWNITDNEKRFKLHLNTLGIENDIVQQDQIQIYSSGQTIYFKNLKNTKNVQIRIFDITGKIVLEKSIQSSGFVSIPTNLKSGIYIVSVINENEIQTEKVIIN
jgi:hypothetical protein